MLQCKNLSLTCKDGEHERELLHDINLVIETGESVVFFGPSGSGKSSLMYLLSLLRVATTGEVYLDNNEIMSQNDNAKAAIRKKHFGFIFQQYFLLPHLNVLENVLVPENSISTKSKQKATTFLEKLELTACINKKIHQLSGGECQRVAIARALIHGPTILFADEPTAALDHKSALSAMKMIREHKGNGTLILTTHDTSILTGQERILKLEHGKITEIKHKNFVQAG
ncbi:MAG: ATP-binding cassette domain-containing protein [Oscillospiraceae bacterium]|jgi:putative ABC transport system ATP-binding protein|nr:ATP-binding cassette domain-containing protein [Oscillospiraceae bacterium]